VHIVQLTPGAGKMYCGACFRDNALVGALRQLGHEVTMLPLYLPLTLDETDETRGAPIFYNGINVYLAQKSGLFRSAPNWFRHLFASPKLLEMAAGSAGSTQPSQLGELTISMLKGEEGNQARELDELIAWLRKNPPTVISLSNALLVGMARRLKRELRVPIICSLQGEDVFLNGLPAKLRERAWQTAAERATDVDLFIAPTHYFGDMMAQRLNISASKLRVLANGIRLEGYNQKSEVRNPKSEILGYFARMCPDKGLHHLVDAYIELHRRRTIANLKLKIGGSCGPSDERFVEEQKAKLRNAGLENTVEFHPNLSREQKLQFLHSLTLFSVPAMYGEAFGMYIIEALAAGVPVVQPRHAAFPELVESTGGGILYDPLTPHGLADALESLAKDPEKAHALSQAGQRSVFENFNINKMAQQFAQLCSTLTN
jgi:glycosyltransferase involved in cell wall biosynthesis